MAVIDLGRNSLKTCNRKPMKAGATPAKDVGALAQAHDISKSLRPGHPAGDVTISLLDIRRESQSGFKLYY